MTIRTAAPADAAALADIYAYYVRNTAITFEITVPSAEEFARRVENTLKAYPYYVAEENGVLTGYAYAAPLKNREAYAHAAEVSVYLAPGARGKGTGALLYAALEETLLRQNVLRLYACITATERERDAHLTDASIRFHEKEGYRTAGRFTRCGRKFGKWYDVVWMEKETGAEENPLPFVRFPDLRPLAFSANPL